MDTMTNVVGVLIIVLVLIGISLARSVNKVLSDLPPVTPEKHAELKKIVQDSTPKNDPKQVADDTVNSRRRQRKQTISSRRWPSRKTSSP